MPDLPARHFNLAGASNFRDLGGYPARDGRAVRWLEKLGPKACLLAWLPVVGDPLQP